MDVGGRLHKESGGDVLGPHGGRAENPMWTMQFYSTGSGGATLIPEKERSPRQ